jgi:hypothetical protein
VIFFKEASMARGLGLVPVLLLICCATAPVEPGPSDVLLQAAEGRTWLVRDTDRLPVRLVDPARGSRLARALFPGAVVHGSGHDLLVRLDSPESAQAFVMAARWADGMVLARRDLRVNMGMPPSGGAGIIAEQLRRYLLVDGAAEPADWTAVSRALDLPNTWKDSPNHAGLGAIVLSGLVLRGEHTSLSRDRAHNLLSQATALKNVPGWLSWIAYINWNASERAASAESP